jgi:multidrug efflux pump subunit AcrA (membrane-fusion protein)
VLAAGGGVAAASALPGGPAYRTGVVTQGATTQTVAGSGTLLPASEAVLNFPVAGTVSEVAVHLGEEVKAGQVLARLSDAGLAEAEAVDQAVLTEDETRLSADEAAEVSAASTLAATSGEAATSGGGVPASGSTGKSGAAAAGSSSGGRGGSGGQSPALGAVLASLAALETQLRSAEGAAGSARTACAATGSSGSRAGEPPSSGTKPGTSGTSGATGTKGTSGTAGGSGAGGSTGSSGSAGTKGTTGTKGTSGTTGGSGATGPSTTSSACIAALGRSLQVEATVLGSEQQLVSELAAVAKTVAAESSSTRAAISSQGESGGTSAGAAGASNGSGGVNGSSGASGTASVVTPAVVDEQQAKVDAAELALADAERQLSGSELSSPISGTVAALGIATGRAVSAGTSSLRAGAAGSTTDLGAGAAVVVMGAKGMVAVTDIAAPSISNVRVGQDATVTPAGGGTAIRGQVSAVGLLPTSGGSADAYPVTVELDGASGLRPGSGVSVSIVVRQADHGLVVPTSALHLLGASTFVDVLVGTKLVPTSVTLGAMGAVYTEVTSGLRAGERVVLARLDEPLPSTTTGSGVGALAGGFGGFGGRRAFGGGAGGGAKA